MYCRKTPNPEDMSGGYNKNTAKMSFFSIHYLTSKTQQPFEIFLSGRENQRADK